MRLILLIGYMTASLLSNSQSIESVRKAFHAAVLEPEVSKDFHAYMSTSQNLSPTIRAYRAVSEAMLAQVLWNPFSKLSQVKKYQREMEIAVKENSSNIEIRFLRLAIEYNLPSFLGMSQHIEQDLDMILRNLSSVSSMNLDPGYSQYIYYFLESTGLCSSDQMLAMKQTLEKQSSF
ncbi:MAG: hypothetical protein AAGC64_12125 [Bacteroidota bacterium]